MTKQLRNFCFTINNWKDADYKSCIQLPHKYLVIGKEIGESKTPHLQGYCELTKKISFGKLKKLLPTAHIERRMGSAQQAATYCKKDDDYYESGEISKQGKRTDLANVYDAIKNGSSNTEIADEYPSTYMRHYKAVDRVRFDQARLDKEFEKINVTVYIGESGTGKTRKAYTEDPNLYRLVPSENTLWFDGYEGQETLLIDDFYGSIKYGYLLQLLDGYKFQLPIKGGFTWKQWKHVIITSNNPPGTWYHQGLTDALKRRLTEIVVV